VALGRLNSIKTVVSGINTNLELYTSSHNSSNVTIHITNQGIESAKFTVGLSSSGLSNVSDSDYIVLGQNIKPREYIALNNIGISSGNTLYCRASKPDISFIAFSVFDYIGASSNFGKENSLKTNLTNNTINSNLLLLAAKEDTNVTLSVNNRSFDSSSFSIGISSSGIENFKSSDYLIYGKAINRNESFTISNVVLSANQSIIVRASTSDIVFSAYSIPVGVSAVSYASTAGSLSGSPNIDVGNIYSVGVITATGNLTVNDINANDINANDINANDINANDAIFGGNIYSVGVITATGNLTVNDINANNAIFSGNVSVAGTVTYEDVTNVDSIGIITARDGLKVLSGGLEVSGVSTFNGPIFGGVNVSVIQVGYSGTNYIGTSGTTISIGSSSNAYGTRYISVGSTPSVSVGENGDIFYVV